MVTPAGRLALEDIEADVAAGIGQIDLPASPPEKRKIQREFNWNRPTLYPKQLAAIYDPRRISVIEASTKSGKTAGSIIWLTEQVWKGRDGDNFWWVAPVSSQAEIAFRRMQRDITNNPDLRDRVACFQAPKRIIYPGNKTVWFKSGDHEDSLYGEDVRVAVIDEASRFKESAWHAVRTTLTATRGKIRIIGNVKGRKNWFYLLARRAEAGHPEMGWHRMTATDAVKAGVLAAEEIEDARGVMPEAVFRELYMAEASDDESNPFGHGNIDKCIAPLSSEKVWCWGWDLAKRRDWTVGIGPWASGSTARAGR
jgi:hypothetical protein